MIRWDLRWTGKDYANNFPETLAYGPGFKNKRLNQSPRHYPLVYAEEMGEPIKGAVLLEFTGLEDKNGKEIYERDIILGDVGFGSSRFEVIWFGEGHGNCWYPFNHISHGKLCKVIGSIQENPELLKEGKKDAK